MKVFSGSSNKPLAEKIVQQLNTKLSPLEIFVFPDGERRIQAQEKVLGEDCVVVQSTCPPVDENYMELFLIIDAIRRSGAKSITAVIPYFGYQRQDHVFREGEARSLEVVVRFLETVRATRVIGVDFHSVKVPELFSIPCTEVSALPLFAEKIRELLEGSRLPHVTNDARQPQSHSLHLDSSSLSESRAPEEVQESKKRSSTFSSFASGKPAPFLHSTFLVSPDMGGLRRIKQISEMLDNMPYIATVKNRDLESGAIEISEIEGKESVISKRALIVDDMISSGKTVVQSADLLFRKGVEEICVFVTHAVFSEKALQLLQDSRISKIFATDSVFIPKEKQFEKLHILSVSDIIAKELQASSV